MFSLKITFSDYILTSYLTFFATSVCAFALLAAVSWLGVGPLFSFLPFPFQMGVFSKIKFGSRVIHKVTLSLGLLSLPTYPLFQ